MERNLVHAEGDSYGQPFRLRTWERGVLDRIYELRPDGRRRYRRVLLGLPKGSGKSELAAAIGCAELDGLVVCAGFDDQGRPLGQRRLSPDVPIAAASLEQANHVFGAAKTMVTQGGLRTRCHPFDLEIQLKRRPGSLYRVAAVAGANDGGKHSCFIADEVHEWMAGLERVHLVLSNNCEKRADSWELNISTAGWDRTSLLGKLYDHGLRVAAGEEADDEFLMIWHEAPKDCDLSTPAAVDAAVRSAYPAGADYVPLANIVRRFREIPEHEFRRYYLNQWTAAPTHWIPADVWALQARPATVVPTGTRIAVGFDGSYNRDSTALMGCTLDTPAHLFVLGCWERPGHAPKDWTVPRAEVLARIDQVLADYQVVGFGADDTFGRIWSMDLEALAQKGVAIVEWPTRSQARMAPAAGAFYGALKDGRLTHDGDARLTAHVAHCVTKGTRWGLVPVKESQDSPRRIDLAIAAVIAYDVAGRHRSAGGRWLLQE